MRDSWDNPVIYKLVKRYQRRPALSFYHTAEDPYEMNDLATEQKYKTKIRDFKKELEMWMKEEGDPGVSLDTQRAHLGARQGNHLF